MQNVHFLTIQKRVISAVLLREIIIRYGRNNIGFLWFALEPPSNVISFSAHELSQSTGERHRILRIPPLADAGRSTDLGPVDPGLSPQCRGSGSTEQRHDRLDLPSEGSSP